MSYFPRTSLPPRATIHLFDQFDVAAMQFMAGGSLSFSATFPSANMAFYYPIHLDTFYLIQKFFWMNGNSAAGSIDCGLYTQDGTLITHTGSTSQSGISNLQSASITPLEVGPGQYYLALVASSSSTTFYAHSVGSALGNNVGIYLQASAFPLPATATFALNTYNFIADAGFTIMSVI
jgi:hypothetical protein